MNVKESALDLTDQGHRKWGLRGQAVVEARRSRPFPEAGRVGAHARRHHRGRRHRRLHAQQWRTPRSPVLLLLVGAVLPWFYLGFKASRRIKAFNAQLPDALQLIAGGSRPVCPLPSPWTPSCARGPSRWPASSAGRSSRRGSVSVSRTPRRCRHPDGQRGLRLGRDGGPHPARGRRQPGRADPHRVHHPARAGVPAPTGSGPVGRRSAVGLDPLPDAAALPRLPRS